MTDTPNTPETEAAATMTMPAAAIAATAPTLRIGRYRRRQRGRCKGHAQTCLLQKSVHHPNSVTSYARSA